MSRHIQDSRASRARAGTTPRPPRAAASSQRARPVHEGAFRWRLPADGQVTEDLPSWRAFTGQTLEELQQLGWLAALHPADRSAVRTAWQEAIATRSPLGVDCRVRRHDGVFRSLSLHLLPQLNRRGQIRHWEGSSVDITLRKEEELASADRAARAQAAETAELLTRERAARRQVEALNADLLRLQALTDTALSHLELDRLLHELLGRLLTTMRVDDAVVMLLEPEGSLLELRAARGLEELYPDPVKVAVGEGFSGAIAATRAPLIVDDVPNYPVVNPLLRRIAKSVVGVPLLLADQLLGVLYIGTAAPRRFTDDDVQVLQRAADRVALAIDRARAYEASQQARQEAEVALERAQASEARFRAAFESAAIGTVVVDTAGHTLQANDYVSRMLGYSQNELRAMPFSEFTHPGDVDANLALTRQALAGAIDTYQLEKRYVRKDGEIVWGLLSAALIREAHGAPLYFVVHIEDITARKRLEQERSEQAEQLDRIFAGITDGLVVFDAQGLVVRMNPAALQMFGLGSIPDFSALRDARRASEYGIRDIQGRSLGTNEWRLQRLLRGETEAESYEEDVEIRTLDGRTVELTATVAPLRDGEGRLVGAVGMLHDLTERNRLMREREEARVNELALQEANRRMQAFLGSAGHELRTPLTALKGNVQLLRRRMQISALGGTAQRDEDPPVQDDPLDVLEEHGVVTRLGEAVIGTQERLERMEVLINRLTRLVEDVIEVSRAQVGKLELRLAECDLAEVVREAVHEQRQFRPRRTILTELGSTPVRVRGDADRLAQVVTNYVSNALKHAPGDGSIQVSLTIDGQHARVAVRDHGPGVPVAEQEHIWEEFYQVASEGESIQQHVGLGLGLHICKTIVERHGGTVGLDSAPGEGATFWFILPLASSTSSGAS